MPSTGGTDRGGGQTVRRTMWSCSSSWQLVHEGGLGVIGVGETAIVHVVKSEPIGALERAVRVE